ncbi:hypothetical protein H6G97_16280 [Nostoc flagelliforme FACHB-838]|uniref:Uncharacterized protein n=1 Tax=Nostoc flagelliforme FACHB-838 TaxID=2692904 RepID=A0ABR8DNN9_9NOSO|nr:hypothetical protein [Nostoc flagelliforme]MBD2531054.1 hypothetical protein [Nostoc flagelliforme FACHB-838]
MYKNIESGPGKIFLSQIKTPQVGLHNFDKKELSKLSQSLNDLKYNLALPIVSLSDEEDKFFLMTGLPIYESAIKSGLEQIWVFLIAHKKHEVEKLIEQFALQSKLNDQVIDSEDIKNFVEFLNNPESILTKIRGRGEKYAKKIESKRPYNSAEDIQKQLGPKQSLYWLTAYKEWKNQS